MNSALLPSWSWRHRFYAFLLRRALGPFLTKQSTADLHRSILDIDWSEGKLVIVDVELDPDHLNSIIADHVDDNGGSGGGLNLSVRRACIRRVSINISLLDHSNSDHEASSTGTTRMATAALLRNVFGPTSSNADNSENVAGVALKVHVDLDGLSFVLSPTGKSRHARNNKKQQDDDGDINMHTATASTDQGGENMAAPGFFASLVDSAMKSLRLSINVSGVRLRTCSHYYCSPSSGFNNENPSSNGAEEIGNYTGNSSSACWVDIRLDSARYYDLIDSSYPLSFTDSNEKTTISKALDMEGLTIESNSIDNLIRSESPQTILQSTGLGSIRFTVIEKWSSRNSAEEKPLCLSARHKIDVSFGHRIAVDVDPSSLTQMVQILNTMKMPPDAEDFVDACESDQEAEFAQQEDSDLVLQQFGDEFYKETYDQIMKQFTEARHLARTRELRGGLLVPNQNDKDDFSFDTFFDANDHSVSHSYVITDCGKEDGHEEQRGEGLIENVKESEFALSLSEFTVKVNLVDDSTRCFRSIMRQDNVLDCILMSVGDIRFVDCRSGKKSKLNFSISHFEIESQMATTNGATLNESMLRFLERAEYCDDNESTIPTQTCVSFAIESGSLIKDSACRVDVSLHPIEIIYQERAITGLSDMIKRLPLPEPSASDNQQVVMEEKNGTRFISARCPSIVFMISCQDYSVLQNSENTNRLFQRHGYSLEESGGLFLGIGVELDNFTADFSLKNVSDDSNSNYEEQKLTLSSSHALLFAKSTELKRGRRRRQTYLSRRADLVAFTRDEDSETNALMISFHQTLQRNESKRNPQMKRSSAFPFVLPLSSVKVQQESDDSDDEINYMYEDANRSTQDRIKIDDMNPSDPQYILSSEANEAEKELSVDISSIFFDFTVDERQSLSVILSSLGSDAEKKDQIDSRDVDVSAANRPFVGLSLNVRQIAVVLHGHNVDTDSFSIIIDEMQMHALTTPQGIRNVRLLFADTTLFQLSKFHPMKTENGDRSSFSLAVDRCQRILSRMMKTSETAAKAIFFRSKLCRPMSPETPSFLVDVLFRNGASDDEYNEIVIHCVVYDMTYRYEMSSDWLTSLTALMKCSDTEVDVAKANDAIDKEQALSLYNVVVSFADCNIDYTPPTNFRHASRVIVRVGGVRLTSNVVSPSASVQAFKLSLSDLRLYICNHRYPHNEENALLSCAHRYFNNNDLHQVHKLGGNAVSWEDVLFRMNFVNLIVLDSFDAVILQSNDGEKNRRSCRKDPAIAIALTLGHFSLYACHDSFSCFNQTYNEWFIKFSSLTNEELEALRVLSEAQLGHDISSCPERLQIDELDQNNLTMSPNSHFLTPPSRQQQLSRDDVVSMDLTETLLFENYYTIDANNSKRVSDQRRMMVVKEHDDDDSESSEDDWATVEHDYSQSSGIPPEDDQKAEWIVQDSVQNRNNSQKLKIFPQHIPVKPVLDPLAESSIDTAKLAGTEVAPDIGLRLIVKDASITIRLFDGFDYMNEPRLFPKQKSNTVDQRDQLLSNLIGGEDECSSPILTEDSSEQLRRSLRKYHRNVNKYFQLSFRGLKLKQDSFVDSMEHRLASYLDLSVSDFYIAEAISNDGPIKLMGEWMNESEHPRDDSDGMIMLQIVTKHPSLRVSADGKLMSDESRATLELLPLRCYFNQKALRFIRNFFAGNPRSEEYCSDDGHDAMEDAMDEDELINIFFNTFKVRPCKLKVDYIPEKMDIESLRDGNYSEILNLCPLEDMILNLAAVQNYDLSGWGSVFSELAGKWVEDICSTQAHKFFTRAAPIQLLSTLGNEVADLAMVIIVPEDNVSAYLKNVVGGTTSFASKVAVEAISTSAKLTKFAANQLTNKALARSPLPRPRNVPRNAADTATHAYESLMRGLREANHNICVIPVREYQQGGASGACRGAIRGIPLGVVAPIAGASEALSYTLLGIRNQLRPDKRKELENLFVDKD
jgi:autophagy-related protein 2